MSWNVNCPAASGITARKKAADKTVIRAHELVLVHEQAKVQARRKSSQSETQDGKNLLAVKKWCTPVSSVQISDHLAVHFKGLFLY